MKVKKTVEAWIQDNKNRREEENKEARKKIDALKKKMGIK